MNIARKVNILDLIQGEFVKDDTEGQSFLKTKRGNLSKLRVLATIIDKYVSEDSNYAIVTLDDSTETIRAKLFKEDVQKLSKISVGDIVDLVGRIKEYDGEIYIQPDCIQKISDPNFELLRKVELLESENNNGPHTEFLGEVVLKKIFELGKANGVELTKLVSNLNAYKEEEVIASLHNLMMRGEVFEPKKNVFRVVD